VWPVSDEFLEGLKYSGRMLTKVNLYRGPTLIASDIAIADGSVAVDGQSNVRRTLNLSVPDPTLLDILDPYACDVRVWRGMLFGNGIIEWVPQGLFRVWDVKYSRPGLGIDVTGLDRGGMVDTDEFIRPDVSPGNSSVIAECERILTDAGFPGLLDETGLPDTVGQRIVWDGTRWEALNALAASLGSSIFFDAIGTPIISPDSPGLHVWDVEAGTTGVLVKTDVAVTREGVFNCVIAEGEHPKSNNPIRTVAKDLNSESPTFWDTNPNAGGFGHAVTKVSSAVWNTQDKCDRAATRILARSTGKVRSVDLSSVPNPALEPGDVLAVSYVDGTEEELVVDSFTVPLVGGDFTVKARSKRTMTV